MTEKQERILSTALKLFANEGFASTSTSRVAKEAGVSEGLIFRHFKNKEGLLQAIVDQSAKAAKAIMAEIMLDNDPKEIIKRVLEMPYSIEKEQYEMWRLTYALKWQTDAYTLDDFDPVKLVIKEAFKKLGYEDPEAETELLFILIDGAATAILLREPQNKSQILKSLLSKYNL